MSKLIDFFKTAPKTKSVEVLKLEWAGKSHLIMEAVEDEKKGRKGIGKSKDRNVIVRRIN